MTRELTWGSLVFDSETEQDTAYRFDTVLETSFGNPVPLTQVIRSMLTDGDLAVVTGYGNREEFPVILMVSAPDGESLAEAEAALMTEVMAQQKAPLIWTPPVANAWPLALDIVTVRLDRDYPVGGNLRKNWLYLEQFSQKRIYRLSFTALPWARDLETTIIEALPAPSDPDVPPVVTSINDCTSTSGWDDNMWPAAAWSSVTVTTTGGYVRVAGNLAGGGGDASISAELTDSETMGSTKYLQADIYPTVNPDGSPVEITAMFDGGTTIYEPIAAMPEGTPGVTRYYFEGPASWSLVRFRRVVARPASGGTARSLQIHDVSKTDRIEIDGANGFQVARTALVSGSAPTQAALRFGNGTDPLVGSTALVYTGTSPAVLLRALLDTYVGTVTPDDAMVSGASNDLDDPMVFLVPVEQLRTATFSLVARLNSSGSETVEWSARVVDSAGADIPGSEIVASGTTLVVNDTGADWMIHTLASIHMPVVGIEGSTTHCVEVTLSMSAGGTGVLVDEAWLLDTDNGAMTVVHDPSAFTLTGIELHSPQLDAPRPAVIGTWDTHGSQDIARLVTSFGTHLFWPGLLYVLTVDDEGRYAPCEFEYYRRHHTHPGPDAVAPDTE